ncbi:esterase [Neoasaia chiangmaiensis NBRC 101099]|uniref:Esterase n=1 Tax=Neoasaia chiangmaiensis TaxID=320497 RepID=A0A1U9KSD1_9PROT|nr:alpha/beta fold hydrolase [Neoasaia chiangmaiensis]AQS88560.1 esterase [Neoasaia chiangmaiensis]GBR36294.1 esterase [Neoasaia chiangmaiensis NBRC 101099]GEN15398.1 alpha/beta hydrolase [Neoasaia chiangmaiensis]
MRLNVIERRPEGGETGLPVVFLHGLFGRARNLGFLQRQVSRTRRTLALDLRSHGESPHGRLDYPAMVGDVMETLGAYDALPAILIGHSMGGKVAMVMALQHPERVGGLLVGDMAPARTGHGQGVLGEAMLHLHFPPSLDRQEATELLQTIAPRREVRDLILQNLRLGDAPGWEIGLREIVDSMANIENWPYMPEGHVYDGPTLFVRGENSPYVGPEHLAVMGRLFPNYRLETMAGVGHWLHAEDPRRFSELMMTFLAGI